MKREPSGSLMVVCCRTLELDQCFIMTLPCRTGCDYTHWSERLLAADYADGLRDHVSRARATGSSIRPEQRARRGKLIHRDRLDTIIEREAPRAGIRSPGLPDRNSWPNLSSATAAPAWSCRIAAARPALPRCCVRAPFQAGNECPSGRSCRHNTKNIRYRITDIHDTHRRRQRGSRHANAHAAGLALKDRCGLGDRPAHICLSQRESCCLGALVAPCARNCYPEPW